MNHTKAEIITQFDIVMPSALTGVDLASFITYLNWIKDEAEIKKRIIDPFKKGVFKATDFNDYNRPEQMQTTSVFVGEGIEFIVQTKPTTKKPSYATVTKEFGNYLNVLLDQHSRGISRKDVRTFKDEPYVSLIDVEEVLRKLIRDSLEGKEGVEQKIIEVKAPEELLSFLPSSISLVIGRDYSSLSDYNARVYIQAENFVDHANELVKPFKGMLLEDSLTVLGIEDKKQVSEIKLLAYAFEGVIFYHQIEPRTSPKHAEVVEAFTKPVPSRITRVSKIGDFELLKLMHQMPYEELEKKGLINEEFKKDYAPEFTLDTMFVRLEGVIKRLNFYLANIATKTAEQNIYVRPKLS